MASTRNRNTPLDYNLEKKNNNLQQQHNLYLNSSAGRPTSECMPAIGYTPSHMAREALSNNSIDIVAKDNDHLIFVDVNTYYKNQDDLKKDNEVDRLKKNMLPAMNLYLSDKLAVSNFRIAKRSY